MYIHYQCTQNPVYFKLTHLVSWPPYSQLVLPANGPNYQNSLDVIQSHLKAARDLRNAAIWWFLGDPELGQF